MEFWQLLKDAIFHLSPTTMNALADHLGPWLYVVVGAIVFAETGLVALPFLPGDSLLFTLGALAAADGSPINLPTTALLLLAAAIAGDAVNYAIGYRIGPKVFSREDSWLLNKKHLLEAQRFYDKYGGKTIILARFVPIVRTFAPFVAGIGKMNYLRFAIFNVTGGVVWVLSFLLAGWWFAGRELVQKNFHLVVLAIIAISILPAAFEIARAWWTGHRGPGEPGGDGPANRLESDTARVPSDEGEVVGQSA
jgi:membrane-associated protein